MNITRKSTTARAVLAAGLGCTLLAAAAPAAADNEFGIPGGGAYPQPAPAAPAPAAPAAPAPPGAPPPAAAPGQPPAPNLHHVRYTVTSDAPFFSRIYSRETDPPTWSDYSHNPFQFSPRVDVDLAPERPWVFETNLADPALWAMVVVQSGESPNFPTPGFNCELAVDGVVVKTNSGPKGALCSLRAW